MKKRLKPEYIYRVCKATGHNVSSLAREMGVARVTMALWACGTKPIPYSRAGELAAITRDQKRWYKGTYNRAKSPIQKGR